MLACNFVLFEDARSSFKDASLLFLKDTFFLLLHTVSDIDFLITNIEFNHYFRAYLTSSIDTELYLAKNNQSWSTLARGGGVLGMS